MRHAARGSLDAPARGLHDTGMTTHQLTIEGMNCGHCVRAVERALREVAGVERVEAEVGRAKVEADPSTPREALRAALEDAGFTLV